MVSIWRDLVVRSLQVFLQQERIHDEVFVLVVNQVVLVFDFSYLPFEETKDCRVVGMRDLHPNKIDRLGDDFSHFCNFLDLCT